VSQHNSVGSSIIYRLYKSTEYQISANCKKLAIGTILMDDAMVSLQHHGVQNHECRYQDHGLHKMISASVI